MPEAKPQNLFFPLTALCAGAFIVTILALIASIFGDPAAPMAVFLEQHGSTILAVEVGAIIVTGFLAMFVDRRRTLAELRKHPPPDPDTTARPTPPRES